ncbi:MAG: heptosyltransferase-2 [Pseudohongiellaceae bacterium]|jgi:heptosyltransferase-2
MDTPAPERLLVRLPNWIGDVVMATPALAALRRHWPATHITVGGPAHCLPLLSGSSLFDSFLELPRRNVAGWAGLLASSRLVASGHFNQGVLLTNSFSSALVLALARVPARAGYRGGGRGALLTASLSHPREPGLHRLPTPMVEYYFRLLEHLGVPRGDHHYQLETTAEDELQADEWLQRQGLSEAHPLVGFHPGSSFGPSKLWYADRFAAVADGLAAKAGARVVVFCGPGERDLAREIAAVAKSSVVTAADDMMSLATLKAVIRRLDLLISTDTGPRHFGPAFDVPTVVLMGSTDPRFTNTNLSCSDVLREPVFCSPCQKKVCPIDHRCMTQLTVERVLGQSLKRIVGATGGS